MSKEKYSLAYQSYLRSHRWRKKSAWLRSLTRPWWLPRFAPGRCCLFPWLPNRETHHLTYFSSSTSAGIGSVLSNLFGI
ncbi:MAG: hypothetical protein HC820_00875 [Hydrococcus sp. RM1_1_31]|nr:hypothetical protein [Hydrococcus sp. RM1_1_31]